MQGDHTLVADGGKSDYLFGTETRFLFEPVKVDRVLRDGDMVSLGDVQLTARLTPGHTPGSTTWMTTVEDAGRKYVGVFPNSGGINAGTRLVNRPSYPTIADDYRKTFAVLERGFQERSLCLVLTKIDPQLDPLRSDPRYTDLIRRIGFPP